MYEVSRTRNDLENKVALFTSEIERLNLNLNDRKRTIETQQTKISQLEQIIGELREKERLLIEYENKIALFTQEIERLNNSIRNKQN